MTRVKRNRWTRAAMIAGISLTTLAVLALILASRSSSRKPDGLGANQGQLAPCPKSPNCVSTQCDDGQHRMEPIPFIGKPTDAVQCIKQAIDSMPRHRIVDEQDDYIHVEATSRLFRFVDDVEFYIDSENQQIHFRSASRAGFSDFGVNRSRMNRFRRLFEEIMATPHSGPD